MHTITMLLLLQLYLSLFCHTANPCLNGSVCQNILCVMR